MRPLRYPAALAAAAVLALAPQTAQAARRSPTATARTHFVKVNGARLAYRVVGKGPPLVMIMGLGGTMDAWDPRFVDAIAHRHRVVLFDNRGVGLSGGAVERLSVRLMANDAHALIRRLRLARPDVIGWSMGGFVAQDLALRHPRDVDRLVLAATAPHAPRFVPPTPDAIAALSSGLAAAAVLLFPADRIATDGAAYGARLLERRHPTFTLSPLAFAGQLRAVAGWATGKGDDPRGIHAKTLIGEGADDHLLPAENSRRLARRIRGSKLKIYPHAAHGFFVQHDVRFDRVVLRFLAR